MPYLGIESLVNPLLLPKRKISRSILASSYDRRGGNHDWSNYIRREGKAAVMMEADGPGCITRIWTADPQKGTIKIYLDKNPKPAIETQFSRLFDFLPLSSGIGGESPENYARSKAEAVPMGHTSYCPIPFQQHCKITIEPEDDYLYYHVNADLYPPGTQVDPYSLENDLIVKASKILENYKAGKPLLDMSAARKNSFELAPDQEHPLLQHEGPGIVGGIRIALPAGLSPREREHARNNIWLIAHFDEDEPRDPSIRAPIGPLCLDHGQSRVPKSLFLGSDEEGYYCFFPMPHHLRARMSLINRSMMTLRMTTQVLHETPAELDEDMLRFRATWHIETPFGPDHRDYEGLACRLLNLNGADNVELLYVPHGAGHFVGTGFVIDLRDAPTDRAAGEGDEMFFIDDDPRLSMYGTGTEDYVNDAWGIRGYVGPLSGDDVGGDWGKDPQIYGYRLHVPDPVPFVHKGRFTLEHGTGNNCSGCYRSVAYWYMDPSLTRTRTEEWRWEAIRTGKRKPNQDDD